MTRQPAEVQTLYAELSERLRALDAARSFASLAGSFSSKHVRGVDYWYFKPARARRASASTSSDPTAGKRGQS